MYYILFIIIIHNESFVYSWLGCETIMQYRDLHHWQGGPVAVAPHEPRRQILLLIRNSRIGAYCLKYEEV